MKICEIIVILEVSNHHRGADKTEKRKDAALATLRESAVGGCRVLYVFENGVEPPTQVPDFGHNYKCKCKSPEPWGVSRYFGLTVIVSGDPLTSLFQTYQLTEYSRLEFCGKCQPVQVEGHAPSLMVSLPAMVNETA